VTTQVLVVVETEGRRGCCVQHAHESESEGEAKQKRHRRDGGRRNGGPDELEDGEVGEDGEIQ
jgi:hypothetical protein